MGRLEIPLPEMGEMLSDNAKKLEDKIKKQTPTALRGSIKVGTYKKGEHTGLAIEYDDRAENFVYTAMEYPLVRRKK